MNVPRAHRSAFLIVIFSAVSLEPGFTSELRISEFLASNQTSVEDADGDSSDWIEIENIGGETVALDGWFLTDDRRNPNKWPFPNVELAPGEYLVVFASRKDRAVAGAELHTNFALSVAEEYVALVRPDGSVASEFGLGGASFPPQLADVSYGISVATTETSLVAPGATVRTWVPTDGALGASWQGGDSHFDDSDWREGTASLGYETEEPQEPSVRLGVTEDLVLWLDATAGVTTEPSGRIDCWQDQLVSDGASSRDAVQPNLRHRPLLVEDVSPAGDRPLVRFGDEESAGDATWLEVPHRDELNPGSADSTPGAVRTPSFAFSLQTVYRSTSLTMVSLHEGGVQTPGDANQDGVRDLSDAVRLLEHIFLGGRIDPPCEGEPLADGANAAVMDLNGDARVNIADVIRLVRWIFGREQEASAGCVRVVGCPDLGCE